MWASANDWYGISTRIRLGGGWYRQFHHSRLVGAKRCLLNIVSHETSRRLGCTHFQPFRNLFQMGDMDCRSCSIMGSIGGMRNGCARMVNKLYAALSWDSHFFATSAPKTLTIATRTIQHVVKRFIIVCIWRMIVSFVCSLMIARD